MSESNGASGEIRGLGLTLGVYAVVLGLKLAAYAFSGITALLAEALHTLSDIFICAFLLVAALYSRRKADRRFMFGYGRAQNVAALVAATLFISFTSFELYREAITRLALHETAVYQNIPLAAGVLVFSMLIAAAPLAAILRQKKRGAVLKAQLLELVNDELGLLAALIGTLCVAAGITVADPLASILVATIIAVNAVGLFRENLSFLMGKAPSEELLGRLEEAAKSVEGVQGVHELRAEYVGPDLIHATVHIRVPPTWTLLRAHETARRVDARLESLMGNGICEVHMDPLPEEADSEEYAKPTRKAANKPRRASGAAEKIRRVAR